MTEPISLQAIVPDELGGCRFDQIAAQLFPDYSRACLQGWIKNGQLTADGECKRAKEKLWGGALLTLVAQPQVEEDWQAEDIALNIVYEDESILVIDKPVGLVVHPAAGNYQGTLLNALLFHDERLNTVPRAGIVHRLDKDTSGLLVVAKHLKAHHHLVQQLQERTVTREYDAIVIGQMTGGGTVDLPIGRHPTQRKKMAVNEINGKEAVTHYRLVKRFKNHVHISVRLETGRTHQIRVHMSHLHYPLVGDTVYGGRFKIPRGASDELIQCLRAFPRQALHARRLGLIHPDTDDYVEFESGLPSDMRQLLSQLDADLETSS